MKVQKLSRSTQAASKFSSLATTKNGYLYSHTSLKKHYIFSTSLEYPGSRLVIREYNIASNLLTFQAWMMYVAHLRSLRDLLALSCTDPVCRAAAHIKLDLSLSAHSSGHADKLSPILHFKHYRWEQKLSQNTYLGHCLTQTPRFSFYLAILGMKLPNQKGD